MRTGSIGDENEFAQGMGSTYDLNCYYNLIVVSVSLGILGFLECRKLNCFYNNSVDKLILCRL